MTRFLATLALAALSLSACSDADAPADTPAAPATETLDAMPDAQPPPAAPPSATDDGTVVTGEPDADETEVPAAPAD